MKKYNFKSTIAALICACSLGFQAKATTYNISQVGSASITAITNTAGTTTYNATNLVASTGGTVNFIIAGGITDISMLRAGDVINIPVTFSGHFSGFSQSSSTTEIDYQGQAIFNISYSGSGGSTVVLTATAAVANFAAGTSAPFTITSSANLSTGGVMANYTANTTAYTVDGTTYTLGNQPYQFKVGSTCNTQTGASTATSSSYTVFITGYQIYCLYNQLLNGNLNLTDAQLTDSDVITVATIPASSNIVSVGWYQTQSNNVAYYVYPGKDSMTTATITTVTQGAFTDGSIPPDATMAQLEALETTTLQPGQHAIVQNSDGSYTVAVNWGPLIGSVYNEYGATANVSSYDAASNAALQQAIADKLSAIDVREYVQVNYVDPSAQNSVTVATATNSSVISGSNPSAMPTNPVKSTASAQTTVKIHYVNLSGANLRTMLVYFGYPVGNTAGATPTTPQTITPANIPSYTLVTDAATLNTVTGIPASTSAATEQIMTTAAAYATAFPSTGINDYYYVYEGSPMPITGLQLTAQPQANNDVILTWGTLTEINSQSFTLQRSTDGGKTWITIGTQPTQAANGNSSVPLTYQLTDPSVPIGSYEYRVVETDIDGATTTSNVVQISITGGKQVYPNPANTLLNVKLPAGANSVPYRLISADGKIVLKGTVTNTGNYGQISVAGVASDIYFLQITVNNTLQTYEVRIQH